MFAALPLILQIAPEIARWLGGDQAPRVSASIAEAVRAITGKEDPEDAAKVISGDAAKAAELRVRLAQISSEADSRQREADLKALQLQLDAAATRQQVDLDALRQSIADVTAARGSAAQFARLGSPLAWGAPVLSAIILISFAVILYVVLYLGIRNESLALANVLLGTLAAMTTQVANFWLGSSSSTNRKDELIRSAQDQLARSVPVTMLPRPSAVVPASAIPDGDDPLPGRPAFARP